MTVVSVNAVAVLLRTRLTGQRPLPQEVACLQDRHHGLVARSGEGRTGSGSVSRSSLLTSPRHHYLTRRRHRVSGVTPLCQNGRLAWGESAQDRSNPPGRTSYIGSWRSEGSARASTRFRSTASPSPPVGVSKDTFERRQAPRQARPPRPDRRRGRVPVDEGLRPLVLPERRPGDD